MAPKAKKSTGTMKKVGGKSKQSVSIDTVKEAVMSLGDRNGSTIKSIFNYLVRTKKVSPSSRTLVILAIGRGVRSSVLTKKSPNTFGLSNEKKSSPAKSSKRKTKRARKTTAKSSTKRSRRRRAQRKRKSLKKRSRKASKKSRKVKRKGQTKRKARRSQPKTKKATVKPVSAPRRTKRPIRKAARGKNYRV